MFLEEELVGLLKGYIEGDLLARKILVDALEEADDPRTDYLREETIDWEVLADEVCDDINRAEGSYLNSRYVRFLIECARFGSPTRPEIIAAVREARLAFVERFFPEVKGKF